MTSDACDDENDGGHPQKTNSGGHRKISIFLKIYV